MTALSAADWAGFAGAVAAVTATLAGLLFVAVSINLAGLLNAWVLLIEILR